MRFYDEIKKYPWESVRQEIENRSRIEVERALAASPLRLEDFTSFLSPSAEPYLEDMAQRAHRLTQQRFGRVIGLFAPLYLSNVCINSCVYCGFNAHNPAERLTLTVDQAAEEGKYLHDLGFRHLLLVSGEAPNTVTVEYLARVLERLRPLFSSISIEIYPMETADYQALIHHGVDGLVIYQETYDEKRYKEVHPGGKKRDYPWRLETPERGGQAGFRRIGIGALLGLNDWRTEGFFLALHARRLLRTFWKSHITISFPRLRPASGGYQAPAPVSDIHMVQLLTALRLFLPDAGLILSTRESPQLRDHMIPLGITSMSAGSRTEPGGYANATHAEAQFEIADDRSPQAVADIIRQKGYEPVWKDWDAAFLH
ncbi:MAG: 2-iminoacetate synthase ThiH [Deltaproteobacteria bacterium]|nr:2-iminoacetate synthase ThiH [Deltaproteobacteria bacterium]